MFLFQLLYAQKLLNISIWSNNVNAKISNKLLVDKLFSSPDPMAARPELRPRDAAAGIEQVSSSWSSLIPSIASLCLQCLLQADNGQHNNNAVLFVLCNFEQTNA